MNVRLFLPGDGKRIEDLCNATGSNPMLDLERDSIAVCVEGPAMTGFSAGRRAFWIHELVLLPGTMALKRATSLLERGVHLAQTQGHRDLLFLVDPANAKMLRFARDLPYEVVEQPAAIPFSIRL